MNIIENTTTIRGEFDVGVRKCDADGNPIEDIRWLIKGCKNLITDTGMDRFGTVSHTVLWDYLQVGTGNTAPANSNTALVARVAGQIGSANPVWTWQGNSAVATRTYTFAMGAATGVLAELGVSTTTNGTLTTRALFMSGGTPATVTVLADEQLVVTYRFIFTPNTTDSTLTTTQKGTAYTLTLRPASLATAFGGQVGSVAVPLCAIRGVTPSDSTSGTVRYGAGVALGSINGLPTGGTAVGVTFPTTRTAYVNGSYYSEETATIPLASGNYAGIAAIQFEQGAPFKIQIGISPPLTKTSSDTVKFTVRLAWARG